MTVTLPNTAETLLAEYNPDIIDALGGPDAAYDYVASLNGEDIINTTIRELFTRHKMEDKFGLTLLHRHFNMEPSERLVTVGNTSIPWGPEDYGAENRPLGKVIPYTFIFEEPGQLAPFEYNFVAHERVNSVINISAATKAFVRELGALLFSLKLEKVLGLRTVTEGEGNRAEITVGRANIFIQVETLASNTVPTSWYFFKHVNEKCEACTKKSHYVAPPTRR